MNMSGIERQGDLMYQFNGMIEKEEAFGLELYETPFRSYDAQLGRFWQVEPLADIYVGVSMYQFAYNNPVSFNDPSGLSSDTGSGIGGFPLPAQPEPQTGGNVGSGPSDPGRIGGGTNQTGGGRIGGGGYTWDLGNTRVQPYSMGGRPMNNPNTISIFNLNNDPNVTRGIVKVRNFLSQNGIKINVEEKKEMDINILNPNARQNPASLAQGINAAYLIGEGDKLIEYASKIDAGFAFAARHVAKGTNAGKVELATGWTYGTRKNKMGLLEPSIDRGAFNVNMALIGTHRIYPSHYNPTGFIGKNMSPAESFALIILHVIGHNAGLDHPLFGNTPSILSDGAELERAIRGGHSFSQFTNLKTPANEQWLKYVKHYFSPTGGYPLSKPN